MQPMTKHREVSTDGIQESVEFGISFKDQAHIKSILRDTLYSDKVLAVLREYSSNAWDAHRMVGKGDVPVSITLPTSTEHTLTIKDYGPGLSKQDVFTVFTQYGASTKRSTNDAVGMLGIGSKSGFAYTDSFTIVSRHGGVATTYVAHLDEDENDALSVLSEEPCGEDTGLTVIIAVKAADVIEFRAKAHELFRHFIPQPEINLTLPQPVSRDYLMGSFSSNSYAWYAIMGCVPYKIDLDQLKNIYPGFWKTGGYLFCNIGDLQVSASREALKYSEATKNALETQFELFLDEYVKDLLSKIETGVNDWEKRLIANKLNRFSVVDESISDWGGDILFESPISFSVGKFDKTYFSIDENRRLVKCTPVPKGTFRKHYQFALKDLSINPRRNKDTQELYSWDEINQELETFLDKNKLRGIPIVELSELPYDPPSPRIRKSSKNSTTNKKHHATKYELLSAKESNSQWKASDNWKVAEDPQDYDNDVYVVIRSYRAYDSFLSDVDSLKSIYKFCGLTVPKIYGYKDRVNKRINPSKLKGTTFQEWLPKALKALPIASIHAYILSYGWDQRQTCYLTFEEYQRVEKLLGDSPVTDFAYSCYFSSHTYHTYESIRLLDQHLNLNYVDRYNSKATPRSHAYTSRLLRLTKLYPLWNKHSLRELLGDTNPTNTWVQYIKIMDEYNARKLQNVS